MKFFELSCWPLWIVALALVVAAWDNYRSLALRNKVTMPLILTGWLLGVVQTFNPQPDGGQGGFLASIAATFVAFVMLAPLWSSGWLGAGTVKLQMGFGAWGGAFFGMEKGLLTVAGATIAAGLLCGVMAVFWFRGGNGQRSFALMPTGLPQAIAGIGAMIVMLHLR